MNIENINKELINFDLSEEEIKKIKGGFASSKQKDPITTHPFLIHPANIKIITINK